jgi:hypothetical protein
MTFGYCSLAELFNASRKGGPRQRVGYLRFATAAEAIRFTVEDFPAIRTLGSRCRSETSTSTAKKSIASMRVMTIPCDAEHVNT